MAKLAIDVVLNKAAAMTGLRGMEKDFTSFGKSVLGAVGLGGGMAGLVAGIDAILARAGQLQDVSDAFNVSAESIQRLAAVGVTANLSIEEIGQKLGKLGKAAQEAAGTNTGLAATFAKIGVSFQELTSLNPEQLFNKLQKAVSSGALAGEELKVTSELFARDFQRFLPILRMSTEEFEALGKAGIIMSDAMVASLDAANVSLRQFQNQVQQVTALALGKIIDLSAVFKENPLMLFSEDMDKDLSKALKRREEEIKAAIKAEVKLRAGVSKAVEDEAEANKRIKSEVGQELKLIEQGIAGREAALKISAQNDEDRIKTNLDNFKQAEQEKMSLLKERLGLVPDLEELQAERAGPDAERQLLRKRAQEAGDQARKTGNIEDVTRAQQAALAFQRAKESQLRSQGFGDAATASARAQASQVVGPLPGAAELGQALAASKASADGLGQALAASKASADQLAQKQSAGTKQQEELTVVLDRAQEAGDQARKTGNIEDVTRAQQAALAFQRAKESQLRSQGFGDAATASARAQASQVVGPLPGAAELGQALAASKASADGLGQALAASKASADQLARKQSEGTKQQEKLTVVLDRMQQMANKARALTSFMPGPVEQSFATTEGSSTDALFGPPGIGELFDFKKLLNDLSNPAAPQNLPIELANPPDLKPIMDKLDALIKNTGVFS